MVDSIGFYMLYNSDMSVKNIVFDINGVLVNRPVMKNLLKLKAWPWDFGQLFRLFTSPYWSDYNRGKYKSDEETFRAMGLTDTRRLHHFMKKFYNMILEEDKKLAKYIKKLRKTHKVYILTNQAVEEWKIVKELPIVKNTDGVVVSCECGYMKPEKELFQILIDKYGIVPEETVFVDDRTKNVEAAQEMGFLGVVHKKAPETIRIIEEFLSQ